MPTSASPALVPGRNCWRLSDASRGGFLLSGRQYFRALREAVLQAEHEVIVVAWDISESIEMIRTPEDDDSHPSRLADFLLSVLEQKDELVIRILLWDYSVVYLPEREWLPFTRWRNPGHSRLHFVTDNTLPAGASHHQKFVVIDGALAFCGGFDLGAWRWDSRQHLVDDDRRMAPKGEPYQPLHDIQVVMDGQVAADLRDLAGLRWRRATGEDLPALEPPDTTPPWPDSAPVDFEHEAVGLALTFARHEDHPAKRDIEALHLEAIASARRYIYIENQYLSCHDLVEALCKRLRDPDGPALVMVLTRDTGGWAEEGTLGVVRNRLLELLAEADEHGRFSCCYPLADDGAGNSRQIYVHAKLLIADDRILLTGSANLSNRSMKVDSEIDLAFVHEESCGFIRSLLVQLLAIHFQQEPDRIEAALEHHDSLDAAVAALREQGGHRLQRLETSCQSDVLRSLADSRLLDPDEPISPAYHIEEALRPRHDLLDSSKEPPPALRWLKIIGWIVGLALAGLAVGRLWGSLLGQGEITDLLSPLRDSPLQFPLLTLIVTAAGLLGVPLNLVVIGATTTIGPWQAFGAGVTGAMASAAISFGIGHYCGKPLVRRFTGDTLDGLSAALAKRGVWSVAAFRILPVAPFGVVNLVAGISKLRFPVFMAGSAIGLLPGIGMVTLTTRQFVVALEEPSWGSWLGFLGLALAVAGAIWWLRKRFG